MTRTYFIFFLLISIATFAQDSTGVIQKKQGELIIYGGDNANELLAKHVAINKKKCPQLVKGYRVQIYSSAGNGSRENATHDQIRFLSTYSNINAYSVWEQPNWKVRVGDCRTRFEAEKLKKEIQASFPNCFVVVDYIDTVYLEDCK